jgi:hypothetical protein
MEKKPRKEKREEERDGYKKGYCEDRFPTSPKSPRPSI